MKNVVMIHGYNGIPKIYWWLKQELEKKSIQLLYLSFHHKRMLYMINGK